MKRKMFLCLASALFALGASAYDVAAIIWPAYQPEPRWKELGFFKHGCGEWQNVYEAVSKKDGHIQPKVPLWGYENEADPIVNARRIDAALAAGINVFIYDWYWYQNRPFLENGLNDGFLKAPNNERMKFYLMWANHDVNNLWDNTKADKRMEKPHWSCAVDSAEFKVIAKRWVDMYFKLPNYYKIDGKPVMGLFNFNDFVEGIGGMENARAAVEYLDKLCKEAGFAGVHFQLIGWIKPEKFSLPNNPKPTAEELVKYLHIESVTAYNWIQLAKLPKDRNYDEFAAEAVSKFDIEQKKYGLPYFANATMGWDNNPRYPKEKYTSVTVNATPQLFEKYLRVCKEWTDINAPKNKMPKLILINAWNEWTEGAYMEPSVEFGYGYLNAVADVFHNTKN